MANNDFVFPYDEGLEAWLRAEDYACPRARAGNRFPSKSEFLAAIDGLGEFTVWDREQNEFFATRARDPGGGYVLNVDSRWDAVGTGKFYLAIRGDLTVELAVLERLSGLCGQLVLYPDTGSPCVIVAQGTDIERLAAVWGEAHSQPDPWGYFFGKAYDG